MDSQRARFRKLLNTSRERLKHFTFLVDFSLGKGVTAALRKHGFQTEDHEENFSKSAPDPKWLERAGKNQRSNRRLQYIIITKDKKMHQVPEEYLAIIRANVRQFVITSGNLNGEDLQQLVLENMGRIADFVETHDAPFLARITRKHIEIVTPPESHLY